MSIRWSFLIVVASCSTQFPLDDVAFGDAGVFPIDSTLPDGEPFVDAGVDAPPFNGGGPFLCAQCVCDGTLDLCMYGGNGGHSPIVDASDDADDASDATPTCTDSGTGCMPIPITCLPKPTCACIEKNYPLDCTCGVDPTGNGLVVVCATHP